MKKTVTAIIILIFIFNITGYYIPYALVRSVIRSKMNEEVREKFENVNLIKLIFSLNDKPLSFVWSREGSEFKYQGEMYDIVRIEKSSDKFIYYCLKDNDETKLNDIINILVKKDGANNNKEKINFTKELSKYKLSSNSLLNPERFPVSQKIFVHNFYKSAYTKVNLPPPKLNLTA